MALAVGRRRAPRATDAPVEGVLRAPGRAAAAARVRRIVDLEARLVERWRHGADRPEIASDILEWQPEGAERAFVLELPVFFVAVLGD